MANYLLIPLQSNLSRALEKTFTRNGGIITAKQFHDCVDGHDVKETIVSDRRIISRRYSCYESRGRTIYHCGLISFS
ncbi:MAG TPA: hypothetical protein VJJ82_04905 [Candidatus Nanoarchaeia archaeon]|nr:hypothetical protein [Candidatus Nanoarchaeia archaeon]